jgi:hypothetical protein
MTFCTSVLLSQIHSEFRNSGDNYGTTVPVTAISGQEEGMNGFSVNNGEITAKLDAALDHFFACNSTIDGKEQLALKFGVYQSNGQAPENCVSAKLVQNFNVPA